MAVNYTLKLSDSVVAIDFYSGDVTTKTAGYFVQEGGLNLPPPTVNAQFNQSNQSDGAPMSRAVYGNRTITITFGIQGSSLVDVKAKIRAIQECLNDAAYRYLLGTGNLFYLETQWGVTAGQSTYFDVLRGDLQLPTDYLTSTKLTSGFTILNCKLVLTCLPFGRYTIQTIGNAALQNSQGDLAVGESYITPYYIEAGTAQLQTSSPKSIFGSATGRVSQTFTMASTLTVAGAAIYCEKSAVGIGNVYFEIYAVDANHKPTGGVMATGNISNANIPTYTGTYPHTNAWSFCAFSTPVALTTGTEYALVIRTPSWTAGYLYVYYSVATNPYAGGVGWYSTDNGSTWTTIGNYDFAFAVLTQTTRVNYQEITTDATYGDVPAGTMMNLSGLPTAVNIWVAKRTGNGTFSPSSNPRYQEPLWIEGGGYSAATVDNTSGAVFVGMIPVTGGSTTTALLSSASSVFLSTSNIARNIAHYWYSITTLSAGSFRVLARCRVTDVTLQGFALGWHNDSSPYTPALVPTIANTVSPAVNNTWQVLDLGQFLLPSVANPGSSQLARMKEDLDIYCQSIASTGSNYLYWDIDWIFLLPTDEGYANFKSATSYTSIDSISKVTGIYDDDSVAWASVFSNLSSVGPLPTIGRENTRLYVICDAVESQAITLQTRYEPRYLLI
jgi:hypothetical protein